MRPGGGAVTSPRLHSHQRQRPGHPGPRPARTWVSGSSDMEPLVWMLPLGSLVSMRAGEPGFEEGGAPFCRACSRREWPLGAPRHCQMPTQRGVGLLQSGIFPPEFRGLVTLEISLFSSFSRPSILKRCNFLVSISSITTFLSRERPYCSNSYF